MIFGLHPTICHKDKTLSSLHRILKLHKIAEILEMKDLIKITFDFCFKKYGKIV